MEAGSGSARSSSGMGQTSARTRGNFSGMVRGIGHGSRASELVVAPSERLLALSNLQQILGEMLCNNRNTHLCPFKLKCYCLCLV